mmetsp:Transcript_55564/g.166550  ORF Transcript_55564/g.166550 Transcript_55564/m.166550 type:complete len:118 (-) Transcript_55564:74-427(-)
MEETAANPLRALEGYFDNFSAVATNEKAVLEKIVESNATLTATTEKLTTMVTKLTEDILRLQKDNKAAGAGGVTRGSRVGEKDKDKCPHCQREVWHIPEDCFELETNANLRPSSWKS